MTDTGEQAPSRKIIHVDADAFYAAVEMRERPELRDMPLAVGGSADRRGVVATCNYAARQFGIHSAMASARAIALCPDLVFVKPRFELYREVSAQFHEIFRRFTECIEPLSLDEAYLDVTDSEHCDGSATLIAQALRAAVRDELQLTVSAGVAPNKFLAKVASDWRKPDGLFTITPGEVAAFVQALPVSKINGVGKVTAGKLQQMGVKTCGDLQQVSATELAQRFGKYGRRLAQLAHGEDHRPVQTSRLRKSISVERTYSEDLSEPAAMEASMAALVAELAQRFERIATRYRPQKRFVKVKFSDFTQTTLEAGIADSDPDWAQAGAWQALLQAAWPRRAQPVRLLGAGLRLEPLPGIATDDAVRQLPLWADSA